VILTKQDSRPKGRLKNIMLNDREFDTLMFCIEDQLDGIANDMPDNDTHEKQLRDLHMELYNIKCKLNFMRHYELAAVELNQPKELS
jgi:hypothetical protein